MKRTGLGIGGALALLLTGPLFPSADADAQERRQPNGDSKEKGFEELVKDAEVREGFFDTYQKDGKLYLAVPEERLGERFLLSFEIAQGIGASSLFGGTMLFGGGFTFFEPKVVSLEMHDGKIFLMQHPHRYTAPDGTPEEEAVSLTFGASILESAKVASRRDSDSAYVIDVYPWMVSDLSSISNRVRAALTSSPQQPGRANLDKNLSYLEDIKAFPKNLSIWSKLTFKPSRPARLRTVPDPRFLPVTIHYNLSALPEVPMTPRYSDDRMGYFLTVHKDFSQPEKTFFRRLVNRWRLECADEPGPDGLCTPKKQIVYHIDHTIPEEYRQPMMNGIEAFDEAFAEAGFRDAIRAEMLPEDADPEDVRFATLRWNTSDIPGYGAIGPSLVDPRTGEIVDADILFEAAFFQGFKNLWRTTVEPRSMVDMMLGVDIQDDPAQQTRTELPFFAEAISAQGALIRAALLMRGEIAPDDPVPPEYFNQYVKWVTMHEVGHSLGLTHNFRSSSDTPFDKLFDKEWTAENGVFSSVMEYPSPNIAPPGQPMGHLVNPGMGSYDRWMIAFGYTPDPARAEQLARLAAQPGHAYGTALGPGATDPTTNIWDLSADPMAWGKQRADLVREIWRELPGHVLEDNSAYYEVTDAFSTLLGQYAQGVATGVKYLGGQYQYRDHVGDPNERGPWKAVPREKQLEALEFIVDYAFTEAALQVPADVFQKFGADRWSHWGNSTTFNGRIDYPWHEQVLGFQQALLAQMTHPFVFSRMRDAELKFGAEEVLGIPEMMRALSRAVWSEAWTRPGRNITSIRRDLQRAHLDRMIQLVTNAPNRTPADARAVARMELSDLRTRLNRRLSPPFNFDPYTLAHLRESKARIESALAAGFELEN